MSGAFVVDTDRLEAVVAKLTALAAQADEVIGEVDARVRALGGAWSGDASEAQQAAHAEWVAGAREMHQALVALHTLTDTAHANYTAAVAANRAMWG
ncbi:WXG100 family type VII secretion target [Jatrophihabitans sp. YIM 134969]